PHAGSQALERAELELLHRALRAPERVGDLANTFLLDEALQHDAPLVARQATDEIGQHDPAADVVVPASVVLGGRSRRSVLAGHALPRVAARVPRDREQPGGERYAAPLEPAQVGERVVEHLGGEILGREAVVGPAGDERVDPVEVALVQLGEAARVRLCGLDQLPLVVPAQRDLCRRSTWRHGLIPYNGRCRANVTGGVATGGAPKRISGSGAS